MNSRPIPTIDTFNPDLPSVLKELEEGHYLFLIADAKKAFFFLFKNGALEKKREVMDPGVRPKIKSNQGELYARNTKLEHRRENQMREHLKKIASEAEGFTKDIHLNGVFLGGHQPFFHEVKRALPVLLQKAMRGAFVTELNIPEEALIAHCKKALREYIKE